MGSSVLQAVTQGVNFQYLSQLSVFVSTTQGLEGLSAG
jgi:hypothetical protein